MATATSEPVSKRTIVLRLDEDEAQTLLTITRKIGGDDKVSRRRHTDSIGQALRSVGVTHVYSGSGSIKFSEEASIDFPKDDQPPF